MLENELTSQVLLIQKVKACKSISTILIFITGLMNMYLKVKTSTACPEKCGYLLSLKHMADFPGGPVAKNLLIVQGTQAWIPGLEDSTCHRATACAPQL